MATTLFGKTKLQLVDLSDRPAPIPEEAPRRADLNVSDGFLKCGNGHGWPWAERALSLGQNFHEIFMVYDVYDGFYFLDPLPNLFMSLPQLDPAALASFPPGDS